MSTAPLHLPPHLDSCDGMATWNLVQFIIHVFCPCLSVRGFTSRFLLSKLGNERKFNRPTRANSLKKQSKSGVLVEVRKVFSPNLEKSKYFSSFDWNVFSGSKATYSCGPYGYFRSMNEEIYYRYEHTYNLAKTHLIDSTESECVWNKTWVPATLDPCLSTACQVLEVENFFCL